MNGKFVLVISLIALTGCTTKPTSGYVTHDDPIRLECRDGVAWVVNNSGELSLEQGCDE